MALQGSAEALQSHTGLDCHQVFRPKLQNLGETNNA